jgi:hypothetical protein
VSYGELEVEAGGQIQGEISVLNQRATVTDVTSRLGDSLSTSSSSSDDLPATGTNG